MRVNIEGPLVLDPTEYQSTFNQIVKFKETPIIFVVVSYPLTKKIIEFAIKNDMTGPEYTWIFFTRSSMEYARISRRCQES